MIVYDWNIHVKAFLQALSAETRGEFDRPNAPVGKVLLTSENGVFGGHMTFPQHEIVNCGKFYEITFFCIPPKSLLEDFFHRLNESPDLKAEV